MDIDFQVITGERSRKYFFRDSVFAVENVTKLAVRSSGTHRIETASGEKWIIPPTYLAGRDGYGHGTT